MNKFIKHDFENAEILIKAAINNGLSALEKGETNSFAIPEYLNYFYIKDIMEKRNWTCKDSPIYEFNDKKYFFRELKFLEEL